MGMEGFQLLVVPLGPGVLGMGGFQLGREIESTVYMADVLVHVLLY